MINSKMQLRKNTWDWYVPSVDQGVFRLLINKKEDEKKEFEAQRRSKKWHKPEKEVLPK